MSSLVFEMVFHIFDVKLVFETVPHIGYQKVDTPNVVAVFSGGPKKRKSNNDDKHGHGQEKGDPQHMLREKQMTFSLFTMFHKSAFPKKLVFFIVLLIFHVFQQHSLFGVARQDHMRIFIRESHSLATSKRHNKKDLRERPNQMTILPTNDTMTIAQMSAICLFA